MEKLDKKSFQFYMIKSLKEQILKSDDETLLTSYNNRKLCYLDDDIDSLRNLMDIITNLPKTTKEIAPTHLHGKINDLDKDKILEFLKDYEIILYGRSGMKLNSDILRKILE